MSYKFQLGGYRASGSLTQEGPLTVTSTTADNGSRVSHGHISASHGLSGSSLVVGGTGSLYGIEADGKLAISAFNADWTNAGRTVADGGTFTVAAVSTGGLTYAGTAVTSTGLELNFLDGVAAATITNSKALIYGAAGQVRAGSIVLTDGNDFGVAGDLDMVTYTGGSDIAIANDLDFNVAKTSGLQLGGTAVTSTATELNLLDGSSVGTVVNSKGVIYGAAGQVNATTLSASTGMTGSSLIVGAAGTTGTSISNNGTVKSVNLVGSTSISSSQGITGSSLRMGLYGLTNDGRLSVGTVAGSTGTFSGILKTDDTTDATSKTDGSLQTDGGLSVAKAIYNGTSATLAADSGTLTVGSSTALSVTAAGIVNVNNTTEASSTTDGSLQTDGGLSVAKSAVIGDDLDLLSDSCIINIGSTSKFTLTDQASSNTVMATANHRLAFGDAGEYITGDGTDLSIVSSGDVKVAATALLPNVNDGAALGSTVNKWSDLFLGEGGVINWDNGDMTITQASDVMTVAGGTLTATFTNTLAKAVNSGLAGTTYNGSAGVSDWKLDMNTLNAAAVDVSADSIAIIDSNDSNQTRKESIADLVAGMAGSGLSAASGQLSVDGQGTPNSITQGEILQEGTNYLTGTLLAGITVGLPEASAPTVGDKIILKAGAGLTSLITVTVHTSGSHTVDGSSGNVILESPYSAVTFQYLASGSWGVL